MKIRELKKINNQQFARLFKSKREEQGLSTQDAAKRIGKSEGTVRFVETGFRRPSLETRMRMERVLISNFKKSCKISPRV
jgi:ribosome-binding protein aMBF1 (putative translation factor)